jgi:hypothetical protein
MLLWENGESSKITRLNYAFLMFLLPSFFVIGFFAITEAPCLLFYTISIFCVLKYISSGSKNLLYLLIGGLFLGLAAATRQVFLVGIGPLCAIVFYKQFKSRIPAILLYFIGTMLLVGPLIYLWHGLAPMGSIFHYKSPVSFVSVKHVFLSFGYGFFYFLAIMPAYMFAFVKKHWKPLVVLAIIGLISSSLIRDDEFLPLAGLLPRVCSPAIINIISYLFFKLIGMLSIMAIYFLICELYYNRKDFKQVFMTLSMLAILTTPIAIFDQFSSRYSMQIAPILVLFAYTRIKPIDARMQFLVNLTAIVINVISVVTFFY